MTVLIRMERAGDADDIRHLTQHAFRHAVHSSGTEADIIDALRRAGQLTLSLVAEAEGRLVGHVAISPVEIDHRPTAWFGVGPLSVEPGWQRKGIGAQLMQSAISHMQAANAHGLVLLGDPHYYERFGFQQAGPLVLADVPPEYFQRLPFTADTPVGEVHYHDAFLA